MGREIKAIDDVKSLIEWVTYNFECIQGAQAPNAPHEGRMLAYHSIIERVPLIGLDLTHFPEQERKGRIAGACQLIAMTLDQARKDTGKDRPILYWRLSNRIEMVQANEKRTGDTALVIRTRVAIPGAFDDKVCAQETGEKP